jgi:hypothetical protein
LADSLVTAAALVFALVTAFAVAFQVGLALGAPWGRYAMGGAYPGRFPPRLRVGALVQATLLAVLALIVLADAGLLLPELSADYPWLIWLAVAFSALSTVLNAITRSAVERRIWLPVAIVMLVCSLAVALA